MKELLNPIITIDDQNLLFNQQFAQFYHSRNNNYYNYMSKELFYCIRDDAISLKISTKESRSFIVQVPLSWEINKIKCLIIQQIPSLDFECFHLTHDNLRLPGTSIIQNAIEIDHFQDCRYTQQYELTVVPNPKEINQLGNYYSQKIAEILSPIRGASFQPILNQRYNQLLQILEVKESQKIKSIAKIRRQMMRLQNFKQIRQQMMNQAIALNREAAELRQGRLQGRQQHNNRLQIIVMGAFTCIQMICFGYILGVLLHFMSLQHYVVLGVILLLIGLIQIMRKSNQRPQEQPAHPTEQKSQKIIANDFTPIIQMQQQLKNQSQSILRTKLWLTAKIWLTMKICLFVEILISFMLSLFPNWTMQIHLNFFRTTYSKIQQKINSWKAYIAEQAPNLVDDCMDNSHSE